MNLIFVVLANVIRERDIKNRFCSIFQKRVSKKGTLNIKNISCISVKEVHLKIKNKNLEN